MRIGAYTVPRRMGAGNLFVPVPVAVVAQVEAVSSFKLAAIRSRRSEKGSSLSYKMISSRRLLKPDHK